MTSPSAEAAKSAPGMPLGILGGTFDPIHYGHLRLATEAIDALGLGTVRFVPAGQPTHRTQPGGSAFDRLAMARLAVAAHPGFEVDDAEVSANQPSYTVPTLERVRREAGPHRPLVLLLGVDAFLGLTTWHRWRDLFQLAHIAISTRAGYLMDAQTLGEELASEYLSRAVSQVTEISHSPAGRLVTFAMTPLAISATAIRASVASGNSPRFLLPDAVLDYIQQHNLYK